MNSKVKTVLPFDESNTSKGSTGKKIILEGEKLHHYILVFNNPFDMESKNYKCEEFDQEVSAGSAEKKFRRYFIISENDPIYQEGLTRIRSKFSTNPTIQMKVIIQEVLTTTLKIFQNHLQLNVSVTVSILGDKIFYKLSSSEHNLKVQADLVDYSLQFLADPNDTMDFQRIAPYGPYERDIENKGEVKGKFYLEHIYQRYDQFGNESNDGSIFKYKDKARLVYSMITSVVDLGELTAKEILESQFPQHDKAILRYLDKEWVTFKHFWRAQKIHKVKDYFGEKIAMYFAWLETYTAWLIIPSVIGSIFGVIIYSADSDESTAMNGAEVCFMLYAWMLSIGSTFMDQIWVRREKILAWEWGVCEFEVHEEQRPQYKGVYQKDPISGKMKKINESEKHVCVKNALSITMIAFFVSLVIASLVAIFIYRSYNNIDSWGPRVAGLFNAIQIKILNILYQKISTQLTDWENYENDSDYLNALTIKFFSFQFVNSYSSLFYIAFFKGRYEGCDNNDCMSELGLQLGVIFIISLLLNLIEMGYPIVEKYVRLYKENKKLKEMSAQAELTVEEYEYNLSEYETPLEDYMEVIIGYGYVVLFGISFPFSPLLTLLLCIIELRVDAWKLIKVSRRPFPHQDNSIGVWMIIIQIISFIGAGTNAGLIVFTRDVFHFDSTTDQWICFIIMEHILFLLKMILSVFIPDVPGIVRKGLQWSTRIRCEKLWGKLSDVDKEREARNLVFEPEKDHSNSVLFEIINKRDFNEESD